MTKRNTLFRVAALVTLLPLAACGLLDVEAPGRIADDDLNNQEAWPGLVAGMSYDLSEGMDDMNQDAALFSGELWHGGSYDFAQLPMGIVLPEDMDGEWAGMQQARWVAEDGIRRMQESSDAETFESSDLVAEAYMFAGFSNRVLGEMLCSTAIDGGAEEPHTVHFDRGIEAFTRAIEVGGRAGAGTVVTASYAGRASLRAWKGDWAGAVSDAQQVPGSFYLELPYTNEIANDISYETHQRFEFSVHGTEFQRSDGEDPRFPWVIVFNSDGSIANGANGSTPHFQQKKYPVLASGVPLAKGTEMLVLRAESQLRSGNIGAATQLLNAARAIWGLEEIAVPQSIDAAWDVLHAERGAETWLETRRIWDLRRWFDAGPSAPEYHPFYEGRDTCFPISEEERRVNDNLTPV
jgi:hypothetical protein